MRFAHSAGHSVEMTVYAKTTYQAMLTKYQTMDAFIAV